MLSQTMFHFLSEGMAKLSSNISLEMLPLSQNPTSLTTISAFSCTCLESSGSVHSLFTNCSFLCFPSSGVPLHVQLLLSLGVSLEFILLVVNIRIDFSLTLTTFLVINGNFHNNQNKKG